MTCFWPNQPVIGQERKLCQAAHEAGQIAQEIRGLQFQRRVACEVHNRDQVRDYLKKSVLAKIPPGRLRAEEFAYGIIGMIPEGYPYENGVIQLYLQQLGAFYDTDRGRFVMADWVSLDLQKSLAVHELTHALQDQYFHIDSFIDTAIENSDELLARTALVEGDATLTALLWAQKSGAIPNYVSDETEAEFPSSRGVSLPRSVSRLAIFPYQAGLRYVRFLYENGGFKSINETFTAPPRSTEEILHMDLPRTVEAGFVEFSESEVMIPGLAPEYYVSYRDTLGEFGINALLSVSENSRPAVEKAAAGWGGDIVAIIESQGAPKRYVVWKLRWDSALDKEEFLELYLKGLKGRFPQLSQDIRGGNWRQVRSKLKLKIQDAPQEVTILFEVG